ncbi:MAG: ribosome maturation factor RimM [Polyangiales bacterium]
MPLGWLGRAHGLRGELRLRPDADDGLPVMPPLACQLRWPDGRVQQAEWCGLRGSATAPIVAFSGVDSREAAQPLQGAQLCVARAVLPPPSPEACFLTDLLGLEVHQGDAHVGTVVDSCTYPSVDVLCIEQPGGGRLELPLLPRYVLAVDFDAGCITVAHVDEWPAVPAASKAPSPPGGS